MKKKHSPVVVIPVGVLNQLQQRQTLIDQYRFLLMSLESERDGFILTTLGVNVAQEAWHLDMTRGVLERAGSE